MKGAVADVPGSIRGHGEILIEIWLNLSFSRYPTVEFPYVIAGRNICLYISVLKSYFIVLILVQLI